MPTRPGRTPLTRARVVTTATAIADADGLPAVSMRTVGKALGVEAMSLYHHVADKQDLLDAMVDDVYARIAPPAPQQPWRAAVQHWAQSSYRALSCHDWAPVLLVSRVALGPATLAHHDHLIGVLRQAGLSLSAAGHVLSLVDSYVSGFAMRRVAAQCLPQQAGQGDGAGDDADTATGEETSGATITAGGGTPDLPHLRDFTAEYAAAPGYQRSTEFAVGLHILLDGIGTRFAPYMQSVPGPTPATSR